MGTSIMRVAALVSAKPDPREYWRAAGRTRFTRELRQDGVAEQTIDEVIAAVDGALGSTPAEPDDDLDLDNILEALKQRVVGQFESEG